MISAGDFRNGVTFEMDGNVVQVVEFQHVKPGKGAAFVRTKFKNVITGAVVERSFNPTEKFPSAFVERKDMQYSYNDGDLYYFMDKVTFEQPGIKAESLGESAQYLKEGMEVKLTFYKGEAIDVEMPTSVDLKVVEAEMAIRGDTATGVTKKVTTESGLTVQCPNFVNVGDTIRVDTRTGEYVTRV